MLSLRSLMLCVAACAPTGCVNLPYVDPNVCGNGVTEPGEDCDSFAPTGQRCRAAGEAKGECRYDCAIPDAGASWTKPECPEKWSCGIDGICRIGTQPPGYTVWSELDAFQSRILKLGDMDGDGRSDLIAHGNQSAAWMAEPHIVFFDAQGEQTNVRDIQVAMNSLTLLPVPAKANSTIQRVQLAGATELGIATLEANKKLQVTAVPNPFHTLPMAWDYRMVRVRGIANAPLHERVLIYNTDGDVLEAEQHSSVAELGRPVGDMAGPMAVGNLIDSKASPCDEVILTYLGDPQIYRLDACDADGRLSKTAKLQPIARLPNGSVTRGAKLAFINDDQHLDLLVANDASTSPVYISFGNGDGTFSADPEYPSLTVGTLWPVVPQATNLMTDNCTNPFELGQEFPLAVGDLNRDTLADWVVQKGVAVSEQLRFDREQPGIHVVACLANHPSNGAWTTAEIADPNRDGYPDVVAGSALAPNLDFLAGTGRSKLNPITLRTSGPVQHLVTGDFDIDQTTDVAVVETLEPDTVNPGAPTHSLAIAFGEPMHVLSPPIEVAKFWALAVDQLVAANYETNDASDEIGLLARSLSGLTQQLMIFIGNPGRLPIAPLGLWSISNTPALESVIGWPIALTVGRFNAIEQWTAIALARDDAQGRVCPSGFSLWAVHNIQNVDAPPTFSRCLPEAAVDQLGDPGTHPAFLVTGHLDSTDDMGRPLDDVLLVASGPTPTQTSVWRVAAQRDANNDFEPLTSASALASFDGVLTVTSSPLLLDMDGDGDRDLVLLLGDPQGGEQQLSVVQNESDHFNAAVPLAVDTPAGNILGIALHREAGSEQLLGVSHAGVYRISNTEAVALRFLAANQGRETTLPGGDAIASGDVTGDGLPDLVVSGAGKIHVYEEAPAVP